MRELYMLPIALCAGALGAWLVEAPATPASPSPLPAASRAASAPSPDSRLAGTVHDLDVRQEALEEAVAELSDAVPLSETPPLEPEAAEAQEAALVAHLRRRLDGQTPDPAWAAAAEDTVRSWVDDQVDLEELSCGQDLCRFVLRYPDAVAQRSGLSELPLWGPWGGEGYTRAVDGDPLASEVYLAREGASLLP